MEAVTVVARFRGAESGDDDFGQWSLSNNTIKHNEKHHEFNFDSVLNPSKTQAELYEAAGRKIINFFMDGYNATIFAYGQSGSGKTFSMLGPEEVTEILVNKSETIPPEVEALFGILPRATFHIFESIKQGQSKGTKYEVRVSYIEVYNEAINDILACPPNVNLKLREFPNQGMCVIGMLETIANTPESVFEAISAGTANRIVCSTGQNARSSRSHTVFIITLDQTLLDGTVKKSKINLVDLAGSEKLSKTGAQGQALKEAQKINLSLTTLGRCIKALTSGGAEHVPYRESKLTLILKESLSGQAMTTLIVTGSMRKVHQEETISTMQFAERAKMVKTSAKSNAKRSYEELERLVDKLAQEVELLKKGINTGSSADENLPVIQSNFTSVEFEELRAKFETLEEASAKQIEELKCELERSESKMGNVDFVAIHEEIESFKERIEEGKTLIGNLENEKKTQKEDFYQKIENLKTKAEEIKISLEKAKDDLKSSNESLAKGKEELLKKDEDLFKKNQEIQDFSETIKKLEAQVSELESKTSSEVEKENSLNFELLKLKNSLSETIENKQKSESELKKIENSIEDLHSKILSLEKSEVSYLEEASNLKNDSEKLRSEIIALKAEIEKRENENKLLELESIQMEDELKSSQQAIEQELKKLKHELENLKKNTSELNLNEEKENYALEVTKTYKVQLNRIKEEKTSLLGHISELTTQVTKTKTDNEEFLKENNEIEEKLKEIEVKYEKFFKELENEKATKNKLFNDLKTIEESQDLDIQKAVKKVQIEMEKELAAFVQQENQIKLELVHKDSQIQRLKNTLANDIEKLKTELVLLKKEKFEIENLVKSFQAENLIKFNHFDQEKKGIQATLSEKNEEVKRLKEIISGQQKKIEDNKDFIKKLESDVKNKASERDIERKNSVIRQTLIPKKVTVFNKASAVPQNKGNFGFMLKKTDNKFLNDAIKEAEAIAKSAQANEEFKVHYGFQDIKALYANIDDYTSERKEGDVEEIPEEEEKGGFVSDESD